MKRFCIETVGFDVLPRTALSFTLFLFCSMVYAEDPLGHPIAISPAVNTVSLSSSFGVRGFVTPKVEPAEQRVDDVMAEHGEGVVVDYYPFDGEFRVSAGGFREKYQGAVTQREARNSVAYFGVGWQKIVDDSQRLGISLELGAYYDEITPSDALSTDTASALSESSDSDSKEKPWRPAINLEVNYRF